MIGLASTSSPEAAVAALPVAGRRLLRRLDRRIEAAAGTRAADRLRCERAACLARCGDVDAARFALGEVRLRHAAAAVPSLSLSIALHLADAAVAQAAGASGEAHDRASRAYALASAATAGPELALCAAALAELELARGRPRPAVRLAAEALALASPDRQEALARAALVVAAALDTAGRPERARAWYDGARLHASADADGATLGAVLRTMARLRFAHWREARALAGAADAVPDGAGTILLAATSSENLDARLGLAPGAVSARHARLRARILVEAGRTDEALHLLDTLPEAAPGDDPDDDLAGTLAADRAWCLVRRRDRDAAATAAEDAGAGLSKPGRAGDRAPGHARLAQVFEALGEPARAAAQRTHAARAWARLREDRAEIAAAFDAAIGIAPPP